MHPVATSNAPRAIGPYSQAYTAGQMVFCSGQIAIVPETGELLDGDVARQTRQVLSNLAHVLHAADSHLGRVVKTTVYLASMDDFDAMNTVYAEVFEGHAPARATVEVGRLPLGASVEIDAIAMIESRKGRHAFSSLDHIP